MVDITVPDPLVVEAYNQSDAQSLDEITERALFYYVTSENPEDALEVEHYYDRPRSAGGGATNAGVNESSEGCGSDDS